MSNEEKSVHLYAAVIVVMLQLLKVSNGIVTNDAGEVVITSKSAKVQGFLPHSYSPVNSDPARLLTPENLNPIIIGKVMSTLSTDDDQNYFFMTHKLFP